MDIKQLSRLLKPRPRDAHKGDFGHVLVIGGDYGMAGAVRMAGEAALRVGSGLVSIATLTEHATAITAQRPELMCHGVQAPVDLEHLLDRATVVVLGPGLGQSSWSKAMMGVIDSCDCLMLIDADGLNLLANTEKQRKNWVLTPHQGEAARLLDCSIDEVQADRSAAAAAIQAKYGGVCVLKGAGTLVLGEGQNSAVCEAGNPGMASAGMGDILSGVIAGLMAQGLSCYEAACLGVCVHAHAGDRVAVDGERGMLATDLLPHLRDLVNANF